ncbi:MAG TPA: sulfatase-like hydrolase/transferase [Negativicutes bacterium]|nr:sulfatase-like hydrolase/transferase [Negativicutes bacterium]
MKKQPNILVYLSDQQRADTLGCYGQKLDVSPVLDKLAEEGVLFENAFTSQPVCGPARACLQTGKYPNLTGCYLNEIGLKPEENTIAKELAHAGFETAYVGKWHLGCDFTQGIDVLRNPIPMDRMGGYTDYIAAAEALELTSHGYDGHLWDKDGNQINFIGYRADCVTDYAVNYLQNRTSNRPFFLFVSHIEPHQQNDRDCFEGPDGSKEKFSNFDPPKDLFNGKYEGDWKENYPDYLGQCRKLDDNLGKLIDTLKEYGYYEDTVIIYSSDHGCHFRTQEGEYKRNIFDSCLRIPLVIAGGAFIGGKRVESLVSNIQLPTTILELAQVPIPADMVYEPLTEALSDKNALDEEVFFQISETELGRGIRTKHWKYAVHAPHVQPLYHMDFHFTTEAYNAMRDGCKPDSDSYIEQYLFDLDADPYEKNNLVSDPNFSCEREMLGKRLCSCMVRAGEQAPKIYPFGTELPKRY